MTTAKQVPGKKEGDGARKGADAAQRTAAGQKGAPKDQPQQLAQGATAAAVTKKKGAKVDGGAAPAAPKAVRKLVRGTMRTACVRALFETPTGALSTAAIFERVKEQGEVQLQPDKLKSARQHMCSVLNSDTVLFEKVSVGVYRLQASVLQTFDHILSLPANVPVPGGPARSALEQKTTSPLDPGASEPAKAPEKPSRESLRAQRALEAAEARRYPIDDLQLLQELEAKAGPDGGEQPQQRLQLPVPVMDDAAAEEAWAALYVADAIAEFSDCCKLGLKRLTHADLQRLLDGQLPGTDDKVKTSVPRRLEGVFEKLVKAVVKADEDDSRQAQRWRAALAINAPAVWPEALRRYVATLASSECGAVVSADVAAAASALGCAPPGELSKRQALALLSFLCDELLDTPAARAMLQERLDTLDAAGKVTREKQAAARTRAKAIQDEEKELRKHNREKLLASMGGGDGAVEGGAGAAPKAATEEERAQRQLRAEELRKADLESERRAKKARTDLQQELARQEEEARLDAEENAVRKMPLGVDRQHNQFWESPDGAAALYVATPEGTCVLYSHADVEQVIAACEPRGVRERALQAALRLYSEGLEVKAPLADDDVENAGATPGSGRAAAADAQASASGRGSSKKREALNVAKDANTAGSKRAKTRDSVDAEAGAKASDAPNGKGVEDHAMTCVRKLGPRIADACKRRAKGAEPPQGGWAQLKAALAAASQGDGGASTVRGLRQALTALERAAFASLGSGGAKDGKSDQCGGDAKQGDVPHGQLNQVHDHVCEREPSRNALWGDAQERASWIDDVTTARTAGRLAYAMCSLHFALALEADQELAR